MSSMLTACQRHCAVHSQAWAQASADGLPNSRASRPWTRPKNQGTLAGGIQAPLPVQTPWPSRKQEKRLQGQDGVSSVSQAPGADFRQSHREAGPGGGGGGV